VESTTDIFEFFRDLNVFKRNKRRFELKVVAVLLYAFGLSLRKTSGFFWILSEHVSKSSVEEWVRKVEAKLNFEVEPSWHQVVAVDESVVKCCGRPIYVWVAVDAYNNEAARLPGSGSHSPEPWRTPSDSSGD